MIKDILKGLWKWIFWIFILLLLGGIILAFRIFVIDKDYGKKSSSSSSSQVTTDTIESSSSGSSSIGKSISNGLRTIGNATVRGYKEDSEKEYNSYDFDERFLMYEGDEKSSGVVIKILDLLISNAKENFYDKTSVTIDNVTVKYEGNTQEYIDKIESLKTLVEEGTYKISFNYGALHSYVNEIVITKN